MKIYIITWNQNSLKFLFSLANLISLLFAFIWRLVYNCSNYFYINIEKVSLLRRTKNNFSSRILRYWLSFSFVYFNLLRTCVTISENYISNKSNFFIYLIFSEFSIYYLFLCFQIDNFHNLWILQRILASRIIFF